MLQCAAGCWDTEEVDTEEAWPARVTVERALTEWEAATRELVEGEACLQAMAEARGSGVGGTGIRRTAVEARRSDHHNPCSRFPGYTRCNHNPTRRRHNHHHSHKDTSRRSKLLTERQAAATRGLVDR